jgi:hypothetical protein
MSTLAVCCMIARLPTRAQASCTKRLLTKPDIMVMSEGPKLFPVPTEDVTVRNSTLDVRRPERPVTVATQDDIVPGAVLLLYRDSHDGPVDRITITSPPYQAAENGCWDWYAQVREEVGGDQRPSYRSLSQIGVMPAADGAWSATCYAVVETPAPPASA